MCVFIGLEAKFILFGPVLVGMRIDYNMSNIRLQSIWVLNEVNHKNRRYCSLSMEQTPFQI